MGREFQLIELFLQSFRKAGGKTEDAPPSLPASSGARVTLGPGDDAAILSSAASLAVTTDTLVEDVHFRRVWATWAQIGHKALAVNLSDLAAMGARPVAFTCALTLPANIDDDAVEALASGMGKLASRFGAVLAGGNFSRGREISATLTAFGEIAGHPLRRDAARPGDSVLLVGDVGVAAAELRCLDAGRHLPAGRSALLEPEPLIAAGEEAANVIGCAIDISDGLAQDAAHIARASSVAIELDFESIPWSRRFLGLTHESNPDERARMLVSGGEDYALLIIGVADALRSLRAKVGGTVIGRVLPGTGVTIKRLPPAVLLSGHDHFEVVPR